MDVRATGGTASGTKTGDCGCGCGGTCGCENRCCDLECLVRPNFFCGQLLTDADLGATVEWARTRFALSRYRHGWGVVCGLDVTCASPRGRGDCCDDTRGPTVWLNPGYAIDCCGNDLVVCEPMPIDLGGVCTPPDDPCDVPVKPKIPVRPGIGGIREPGAIFRGPGRPVGDVIDPIRTAGDERIYKPFFESAGDRTNQEKNCWDIFGGDVIAVDLTLRYHEDLSDGQRPMFRGQCSDLGACEYTRVLERPCVHAEIGDPTRACDDDDFDEWMKAFMERWTEFRRTLREVVGTGAEALLRYIRRHPPYKFCLLDDVVCCLVGQKRAEAELRKVALLLYMDWLLHEFQCPCPSCRPDRGVPIARVLVRRADRATGQTCRVLFIEASPPYQRPLDRTECRPVRRGAIDLIPYYWQPAAIATDRLGAVGVQVRESDLEEEKGEVLGAFERRPLLFNAKPGQTLAAFVMRDPQRCRRIAAFALVNEP